MSNSIIVPCRGFVYKVNNYKGATGGKGFYSLDPPIHSSAVIIIEGADGLDADIVAPVNPLDSEKILYVFGEDFGSASISGMVLLGTVQEGGRGFNDVVEYFNTNRASKSKEPITLSYPGNVAQKVYLNQLIIAKPDPQYHIQMFQFRGIVAEPIRA